jgi:hypothetical protein
MTLIVDAPATYEPERRYILDVMLTDFLGLDWQLRLGRRSDVELSVDGAARRVVLPDVLFGIDAADWLTPRALPAAPVPWTDALPMLYGGAGPLVSDDGADVRVSADVCGGAFFMLSRYEELVVGTRDSYGRFPASASIAQREGFVGLPVVDAYVELLWSALLRAWPGLERRPRAYTLALTHDVDRPLASLGRPVPALVRQAAADVLVRRDPRLLAQRLRSWGSIRRGDYRQDPYNTFDFLMDVSERHGLAGAFYFLTDSYPLEHPWIGSLMRRIHERGHELGYHAGTGTYRDAQRTAQEFGRLWSAASGAGVAQGRWGGRQHYLQWENPATWCNWERAGLDYDSTVAFADRIGFRAGTCHEFRPFDLRERRPLRLSERPLHVMDATLFQYMGLSRAAAAEAVLDVARQCRRYAGTLTLLWHNSSLPRAADRHWYAELVEALAS